MKKLFTVILAVLFSLQTGAEDIEPSKYVFYLHGAIIENGDPQTHPPSLGAL